MVGDSKYRQPLAPLIFYAYIYFYPASSPFRATDLVVIKPIAILK